MDKVRIETRILQDYNLFEINSKGGFIMTGHDLARMLDGTITATGVTRDEMVHFIQKAKEKEFYSIISARCYLPYLIIQDIRAVKESIGAIPLKCIIEASILSDSEIQTACELVVEGGADFLKTGTGDEGPTTLHHIDLIAKTLRGRAKIKAAGGIRTPETVEQFANAGVERFGISHKSVFRLLDAMDAR